MKGDETKNIDVPSKVRAFRQDFPPDQAAIYTSYELTEIQGAPAVVGRAQVVSLVREEGVAVLSEAYATRGLRAPVPGAQGMKDTRDAERAMTGAVGRALFLMGYGEKADDSVDYEAEEEPNAWFVANGWEDQAHHDSFMEDAKEAVKALPNNRPTEFSFHQQALKEWRARDLHWPLTYEQMAEWSKFLVPLVRKAQKSDPPTGEERAVQPDDHPTTVVDPDPTQAMQLPVEDAVGPDAPLVKR